MKFIGLLLIGLTITACDRDSPQRSVTASQTVPSAAPTETTGGDAHVDAGKPAPAVWGIEIEGMPPLNGADLDKSAQGGTTHIKLFEAPASATIAFGPDDTVQKITIGFNAQKKGCFFEADDPQLSSGVEMKTDGERREISGEVTCNNLGETAPDKTKAKITGWFVAE